MHYKYRCIPRVALLHRRTCIPKSDQTRRAADQWCSYNFVLEGGINNVVGSNSIHNILNVSWYNVFTKHT